ncbi:hypothetical protein PPERSA_06559 [Pseudocohnilembus persalinus]|uniref:AMP-dependent synthetase/ligase domain-containing protein n=1 Tax=Pseudocohnilembus persalinus TaxID=266149 RepID=A0A0V0QRX9_PSEPJ|nr:hypothetical protein PPERSA_06559 [Pseudocohnilembus persalinus]|eukprot:KRX04925.1 hypothetical protein PPERSA_06559 [Pseudocohnilembus persalinus]
MSEHSYGLTYLLLVSYKFSPNEESSCPAKSNIFYMSKIVYAQPLPNSKTQGNTEVYRHPEFVNKQLPVTIDEQTKTVQDMFVNSAKKSPNAKCLGTVNKQGTGYEWKTYQEVLDLSERIGSGIINLNLAPERTEWNNMNLRMVGIYSKNREEWMVLDYANALYRATMVPLYDTLGPDTIGYVIGHANIEVLFIEKKAIKNLWNKKTELHNLKYLVCLDQDIDEDDIKQAEERGLKIHYWNDVLEAGKEKKPYAKVVPKDIHTFSYTSGTTGAPKAAMITHQNFAGLPPAEPYTTLNLSSNQQQTYLSYLPLPHIFERLVIIALQNYGHAIAFFRGDVQKVKEDLALAKPDIFVSVPRIYNKFYDKIKEKLDEAKGCSKLMVKRGYNSKAFYRDQGYYEHKLWDKLIFNKTKNVLGGKARVMVSGSAPLSPEVIKFMSITMCCPFLQGYGQTESTGATFVPYSHDPSVGHVGGIIASMEFKLESVPEMEYTAEDKDENGNPFPRGEVCVRGACVFGGYYKDEEKTKEAIDKDGWLHTGDIGGILPNGALKIIDRKKNIFKLSQGEYVSPEKVENIYVRTRGVQEVFVHGDSLENFCVAIAVVDPEGIKQIAKELKIESDDLNQLCKNEEIKKIVLQEMTALGKKEGLKGFEQAKKIRLDTESFTKRGCQTNTMKLQRHKAKDVYKKEIKEMYAEK